MSQTNIAVDVVALMRSPEGHIRTILAPRQFAPYEGELALPGVLLLGGERVDDAAVRALATKASLDLKNSVYFVGVYDDPTRDPRSTTITTPKLTALSPGTVLPTGVAAVSPLETGELPFDHEPIIREASARAAEILLSDPKFAEELLGSEFTTVEMGNALESLGSAMNRANLSRDLKRKTWLTQIPVVRDPEKAGRPAARWRVTHGTH